MRIRLPHEVSASIVAFATVFLLMKPLDMPTWAIFITWAGTFLQGGPSRPNAVAMITATTTGAGFGVLAVVLNRETGTMLGAAPLSRTLALAVVIFAVNGTLLTLGRLKPFALIPGMFFGFAALFATYFGGSGYDAGNLGAAFVSAAAMCALGPLCATLGLRLTFAPSAAAPEMREKTGDATPPAGEALA
ncbi:DUF1097 domain-containing protein [Actinospica sp. MGRD01-02]|uniref:DUF1097 domain-containing protein n=1 Tax=Actinospica acidithermotolerans TaxID=2828514 RepID=A0A941IGA8_9ACTN|nr:DUF1097 domain-containing protein [Actinospica acidithermotolerans]MBR7827220.1 DUF1097 domain-containing protein [Actinospica acidithermotolerans]